MKQLDNPFFWELVLALQVLLVVLPCSLLFAVGSSSEAREVHVAWAILDQGEWILPHRNGLVPSKPPLYHWLVALLGSASGGVNVAVARIVSVLASAVMLLLTMDLARFVGKAAGRQQPWIGWWSGLVLSFSYLFLLLAGNCRVDMVFSALVLAAISAGIKASVGGGKVAWWCCGIFVGGACLAKGPLGLALVGLIVFPFHFVHCYFSNRRALNLAILEVALVCVVGALVAVPWYWAAVMQGGAGFVARQLVFENLLRVIGAEDMNSKPWHYYGPNFLRACFPWSVLWFWGLYSVWGAVRATNIRLGFDRRRLQQQCIELLPYWWVLVGILFFSCVSGKRTSYLLPLLPGVALAVGMQLDSWWRQRQLVRLAHLMPRIQKSCVWLVCGWVLVWLALDVFILWPRTWGALESVRGSLFRARFEYSGLITAACLLLVSAAALLKRNLWRAAVFVLELGCFVIFVALVFIPLRVRNDLKNFAGWATELQAQVAPEAGLVLIREEREEYFDPLLMYLKRDVRLQAPETIDQTPRGAYVLARVSYLSKLIAQGRRIIVRLNEPIDATKKVTENEIVLLGPVNPV